MAKGRKTGGRAPGTPNKVTLAVREACLLLVQGEAYQNKLARRMASGKLAPAVECMVWHYAYGKPKETVALENPDGSALLAACSAEELSARAAALAKRLSGDGE